MPKIKRDEYELKEWQRAHPVVWMATGQLPAQPDVSTETLELACGPGTAKRVKSWGHSGPFNAHWLVTRGGLGLHTDASYARYTHHLVCRNDGFRLGGWEEQQLPPLTPGTYYCLDTHSPHEVLVDDRIGLARPVYKVQVAVDSDSILAQEEVWDYCTAKLGDIMDGIDSVKRAPPRTGKATSAWGLS